MIALTRLMNLIIHRYWNVEDIKIYHDAHGSGIKSIRRFYSRGGGICQKERLLEFEMK